MRWTLGIVGLALGVRLFLLWAGSADPIRFFHEPDSSGYERLALNLVTHRIFSMEDRPPFSPDHARTPAYPALLAVLYALVGRQPTAAAFLNTLVGAAAVSVIVLAGGHLLGPMPARLAGVILAVDPTSVGYSPMLLTEPLFTLLLSLGLLSFIAGSRPGRAGSVGASGVWLGLASLTRPVSFYLPLLLSGALVLRRRSGWRRAAAGALMLLIGTALLTTPWALRNFLTGGRFELSSIGAVNLYYHRAAAVVADASRISRAAARRELARRLESESQARGLSEADAYRLMTARATEIIGAQPMRYIRLHVEGVVRMLGPGPEPLFQLLGWLGPDKRPLPGREGLWWGALVGEGIFLGGLYLAALAGARAAIRGGRGWAILPAVLFIGYAILVGGPEVYPRFRVPLMPWFAWLGGLGLAPIVLRSEVYCGNDSASLR